MEQIKIERLTGVIAFARAASLGNYSAAARTLGVAPSAVSKSIQRLEEYLGVKLFNRTTRALSLTSEGHDLLEKALAVIASVEDIEQTALSAKKEPAGYLKITAPLPIGTNILAPALPEFLERYPKLKVDLRLGDQFVDLIEGSIDVAIRVGIPSDSRLLYRELAPQRVCAFASPAYLAKRGTPHHPKDLLTHNCVNFRFQSTGQTLKWSFGDYGAIDITPNSALTIDASDAVIAALVAGGGIGISPTYVAAPYVRSGQLVPVLLEYASTRTGITALWAESRRGNPNVTAFLSYLSEIFPSPTPWDLVVTKT